MLNQFKVLGLVAAAVMSTSAFAAGEFGTAAEAKAMLDKVVVALKADEKKALEAFTKGTDGFKDRDLYPYCGDQSGNFTAHPSLLGKSLRDLKDKAANPIALGEQVYASAKPGQVVEVEYIWYRPNQTEPVPKVVYITQVGNQVCGVGYYK